MTQYAAIWFCIMLAGLLLVGGMSEEKDVVRKVFSEHKRCPKCFYDLSSTEPNPSDSKLCCPECGLEFSWDDVG